MTSSYLLSANKMPDWGNRVSEHLLRNFKKWIPLSSISIIGNRDFSNLQLPNSEFCMRAKYKRLLKVVSGKTMYEKRSGNILKLKD